MQMLQKFSSANFMLFVLLSTCSGVLPSTCANGLQAGEQTARQPQAIEQRAFRGRSLVEWRQRMKDLTSRSADIKTAVPALTDIVQDAEVPWFTRRQAAKTLGRLGKPAESAVPVLIALLKQPDHSPESPRIWAAQSLALFGPPAAPATPQAIAILEDAQAPGLQRLVMVELLGRIGPHHPQAIPALVRLLQPVSRQLAPADRVIAEELRQLSTEALAGIGPDAFAATPALMRSLLDPHATMRRKSAEALAAFGTAAEIAIPHLLESMAFDETPAVRDAAETALGRMGQAAVDAVLPLLTDREAELRYRAVRVLQAANLSTPRTLDALRERLQDEDARVRLCAAAAVWDFEPQAATLLPVVTREFGHADRERRMQAVLLVLKIAKRSPVATNRILEQLSQAGQPRVVRQTATATLRKLNTNAAP